MVSDSLHAFIEHGIAELRGAYPRITSCLFALRGSPDGERKLHSLWLEIRWPGHQSIVSGPACESEHAAVEAGLEKARRLLDEAHA
jgi:hypothetical protein